MVKILNKLKGGIHDKNYLLCAKKGIAEDFIEKTTERTQIMATRIFASFAFFAVRFYNPKQVKDFLIFLCVLCDLCGFSNQKRIKSLTNQTKPIQKELKPCN